MRRPDRGKLTSVLAGPAESFDLRHSATYQGHFEIDASHGVYSREPRAVPSEKPSGFELKSDEEGA